MILKDGVVVVNKKTGVSSFSEVYCLRKILGVKKAGHCGTLDPLATGVLPIFLNTATKAITYLQNTDKEYVAKFIFGLKTDTLDITGKTLKKEATNVTTKQLNDVIGQFVGKIEQTPPMFSAVKVKGQALYKMARAGKVVERKKREINIYELKVLEFSEILQEAKIKIFCSKGTYVRSLVEDIAKELGTFGALVELQRTNACGFLLEDSLTIEEIKTAKEEQNLDSIIQPVDEIFKNMKKVVLNEKLSHMMLNGVKISIEGDFKELEFVRVYGINFFGIARFEKGLLKLNKILSKQKTK